MSEITLKQLRYFEAVAAVGHFGRAADACSISQPAISLQIKELEETLGIALFDRGGRQVRLTSFGAELRERTRSILRSVDDLSEFTRTAQDSFVGKLRLGVIPTIAPYLLPRVIAELAESHADLQLNIRETQTEKLIADLIEGRLDTAILALPISEPMLHEEPLFEENFVLVRSIADAAAPVPNKAGLRELKLLLLEEGHCFRDQAISFCNFQSVTPREVMDGSSLSTLVQMVGAGIGVTLIPEMAVAVETKSADVSVAHFPEPQPSRTIGMVWRRSSPLAAQMTKIAEVVGASAR